MLEKIPKNEYNFTRCNRVPSWINRNILVKMDEAVKNIILVKSVSQSLGTYSSSVFVFVTYFIYYYLILNSFMVTILNCLFCYGDVKGLSCKIHSLDLFMDMG